MKRITLLSAIIFGLLFMAFQAQAQSDNDLKAALKKHIVILAADSLKGREAGTPEELMAAQYVAAQFKDAGIAPYLAGGGYLQKFYFNGPMTLGRSNLLLIGDKSYSPGEEYYPLPQSEENSGFGPIVHVGYGISAPDLGYDDYEKLTELKEKVFVIKIGTPDDKMHGSKYADHEDISKKIDFAVKKGAIAIIFINTSKSLPDPSRKLSSKVTKTKVPVVFATSKISKQLKAGVETRVASEFSKPEYLAYNVVGNIDNKAKYTIVVGAHFDHLGMGDEGSLHRGEPEIHNGADDNASGVAGMIELARMIKKSNLTKYNYVFIAFSGEEKGLYGSNYYCKNPTFDLATANCMINFDMIGRLDTSDMKIGINGVGTSPAWMPMLNSIEVDGLKIKTSESGVGPSDHTSFYLKDIPVLHFFSGTHNDYHKPSDDEDKINYNGTASIIKYNYRLIELINKQDKLAFTKTKNDDNEEAPRFTVTLGVVPDYMFDGEGMRIDGITDDKPASKAELKVGDIVVQLGDVKVTDMMSYMKALGKFNKGDNTTVKVKRGNEVVTRKIQF